MEAINCTRFVVYLLHTKSAGVQLTVNALHLRLRALLAVIVLRYDESLVLVGVGGMSPVTITSNSSKQSTRTHARHAINRHRETTT